MSAPTTKSSQRCGGVGERNQWSRRNKRSQRNQHPTDPCDPRNALSITPTRRDPSVPSSKLRLHHRDTHKGLSVRPPAAIHPFQIPAKSPRHTKRFIKKIHPPRPICSKFRLKIPKPRTGLSRRPTSRDPSDPFQVPAKSPRQTKWFINKTHPPRPMYPSTHPAAWPAARPPPVHSHTHPPSRPAVRGPVGQSPICPPARAAGRPPTVDQPVNSLVRACGGSLIRPRASTAARPSGRVLTRPPQAPPARLPVCLPGFRPRMLLCRSRSRPFITPIRIAGCTYDPLELPPCSGVVRGEAG